MDPFSIIVGVGSLVDLSLKLGKYMKEVHEAAAPFEEDIQFLLAEIQSLDSVNKSVEYVCRREMDIQSGKIAIPRQDLDAWQNTSNVLQDCSKTVNRLVNVLGAITGKTGFRVTGRRDGIKKQLRLQAKNGELDQIRLRLSVHRESLNMSLSMLNLIFTQRSSQSGPKPPLIYVEKSLIAAAPIPSLNRYFDTPKTVSSIYTGRRRFLDGLKKAYDSSYNISTGNPDSKPKRFVVFGLGGAGKTEFCCKFALENKQRFWGVFTVDASSPGKAQQSFIAIAKVCGTEHNERAAKSWLSSSDRPWLLLIDNADATDLEIEKYFPEGEQGLTLITTRNPSIKKHGTIGRGYYHFERMDDDEAGELLLRAAENDEPRTPRVMQLVSAIIRELGALPLALVHAGTAIKEKFLGLNNYIPYYEQSWQTIRENRRKAGQNQDDAEYMKVYSSYEIVFRGLEAIEGQRYRDAVELLKLFSFLHYERIPFVMLTAAVIHPRIQREADAEGKEHKNIKHTGSLSLIWQPNFWPQLSKCLTESVMKKVIEFQNPVIVPTYVRDAELHAPSDDCKIRLREALLLLIQLSLVTHHEASDSYTMHPLVHKWVRERPQMITRDQAIWCEAALHTLARCILLPPLNEKYAHMGLSRQLLPHVVAVLDFQQKIGEEISSNRRRLAWPWAALAFESRTSPWRVLFLAKCSLVYHECGQFDKAESCLRVVVDFNRRLLGPNNPRTERAILALCGVIGQQGRANDAAEILSQTLEGYVRNLGSTNPRTLDIMHRLGECRRMQGRFAESLELLTQAKNGMKILSSNTNPSKFRVLDQLGTTLRTCYQFEAARRYQEKALAGFKSYYGETDTRTLLVMEQLGITHLELSKAYRGSNLDLAQRHLELAHRYATFNYEQHKQQLGDKHPGTWLALGTLGRIIAARGNVDEAETIFSTTLPIAARQMGDDHLDILSHRHHHCKMLIQQKRYDEAGAILLDISKPERWRISRRIGDHPDRWDVLWTLVDYYQEQGNIERSLEVCTELVEAMSAVREGREQTATSSTFWNMALGRRAELAASLGLEVGQDSAEAGGAAFHSDTPVVSFENMELRARNIRHKGTTTW